MCFASIIAVKKQYIEQAFYYQFASRCKGGEGRIGRMRRLLSPLFFWSTALVCSFGLGADQRPSPAADTKPIGGNVATDQATDSTPASDGKLAQPAKFSAKPTAVEVLTEPDGRKTLNIHFRWSLFPDARIEVRLVPGAEDNDKAVAAAPVFFHQNLKGKVRDDLFDCLDHPDGGDKIHSFTDDKIVYKMIGRQNRLGNQAVHVQVSHETPKPSDQPAAVYLQLDTWAVDKETLSLDIARDEFPKPGTLFVWFFRGSKLVWEEQVRWPGYK
jgi:hypothetical protein